jgi:hypothetical protein
MSTFVESLSLSRGAIVIAILSTGVVGLLCSVYRVTLRKLRLVIVPLTVVIVPLTFACCLYWSPVWLGADSSEYRAWEFVVVPPWFLAGAIPSAAIALILRKRRSR